MARNIIHLIFAFISLHTFSQQANNSNQTMETTENKLIIEIWSDVVCPFCYLGKRKFEEALKQFPDNKYIQVEWKSFQLNPGVKTDTTMSIYTYLSQTKGMSEEVAKQMTEQIAQKGKEVQINYDFDKTKVINTYNAHSLLHFAKEHGVQNEAKERLLKAYFSEGKNVDDLETLLQIGSELGLDREKLSNALTNKEFDKEVNADMELSQRFGISGVPFFVFDRKYAVSGAQETAVFLETLKKSYAEWRKTNPEIKLEIIEGQSCTPDQKCD